MTERACQFCDRPAMRGRGTCSPCSRGIGRVRGDCASCGKPGRLLDAESRCRPCRDRAKRHCPDCGRDDLHLIWVDGGQVCDPCALRRHLDDVLAADGRLAPLRASILAAEPRTARRWLDRTRDVLQGFDSGRVPLTHQALDQLPQPRAAEHLRALLITAGLLEPDPHRALRRFEARIPDMLDPLDSEHRQIAARWLRWKLVARFRSMDDEDRIYFAVRNGIRQVDQVVTFLLTLEAAGRHLSETHQHDLDSWFAGPGYARHVVRPFLTWARHSRLLPRHLELPPTYAARPVAPLDSEQRWQTARRLVTDDTLDAADRIAAALVVLYAQTLNRVVTLRVEDVKVTDTGTSLMLGTDPLELPEPFATVIRALPIRRRGGTAEQLPTPWLFPGNHAGTHITANALAHRLRTTLGIQPTPLRLAAAEQLGREIPPTMLADVLGLRPLTIVQIGAKAGGSWGNYAADRRS